MIFLHLRLLFPGLQCIQAILEGPGVFRLLDLPVEYAVISKDNLYLLGDNTSIIHQEVLLSHPYSKYKWSIVQCLGGNLFREIIDVARE